ncbi:amidohydrolase family protein [Mycobacterium sp. 3519A]|uniref:amidohydrolase family protein n=1 Tax=Mycobacterium sp. 3519A TaxID=2057184 RepID=UPI001F2D01B8|nr:amidohydrolase family protein [Mycobacterium sp. 3519A]
MLVDRWIDVHAHFSPPLSEQARDTVLDAMQRAHWRIDQAPTWRMDDILAYMDRTGIQMQMLSNIPKSLEALRDSNDFGAEVVRTHPDRFGLLAALPTDDPDAALAEIDRATTQLSADGFAVTCNYNGVLLSDASLDPVWAELDRRQAVVFAHPDAYTPGAQGRPAPVLEVAFETTRTFTDMLYVRLFQRFPRIRFIVAHCGAALPALSGRLRLLGLASWVPNPHGLTAEELADALRRLHLDTAATCPTSLAAAMAMTTPDKLVYGSDCGVPCSSEASMNRNLQALLDFDGLTTQEKAAIGTAALQLFPNAAARLS